MSRRIITSSDVPSDTFTASGKASGAASVDGYRDKLVKYIPAEIISFYITADLLIASSTSKPAVKESLGWVLFFFVLVITPIYLKRIQSVDRILQLVLSTIALAVWVFAMGGPFLGWAWIAENRVIGALVLMAYTFLIPLIDLSDSPPRKS